MSEAAATAGVPEAVVETSAGSPTAPSAALRPVPTTIFLLFLLEGDPNFEASAPASASCPGIATPASAAATTSAFPPAPPTPTTPTSLPAPAPAATTASAVTVPACASAVGLSFGDGSCAAAAVSTRGRLRAEGAVVGVECLQWTGRGAKCPRVFVPVGRRGSGCCGLSAARLVAAVDGVEASDGCSLAREAFGVGSEGGGAFSPPEDEVVVVGSDQKASEMSVRVLSTRTRWGPWCRDEGAGSSPPPPLLLMLLLPAPLWVGRFAAAGLPVVEDEEEGKVVAPLPLRTERPTPRPPPSFASPRLLGGTKGASSLRP